MLDLSPAELKELIALPGRLGALPFSRAENLSLNTIAPDHEEQISRFLGEHFDDEAAGLAWLQKNFDAKRQRGQLTAKRAGQVIRVLKDMIDRRRNLANDPGGQRLMRRAVYDGDP